MFISEERGYLITKASRKIRFSSERTKLSRF